MAKSKHGLSISSYAVIMVGLVLLAFLGYGAFTYSEFQRVRGELQATSMAAAREEIAEVMDYLRQDAEVTVERFAAWEEVGQQLRSPRHYAFWRDNRLQNSDFLPREVVDAEVYDRGGLALAELDHKTMPHQVATPPPPAYVDYSSSEPTLLVFRPVFGRSGVVGQGPRGFVGMRIRFVDQMRERHAYRYVNPQTIAFARGDGTSLTWPELQSAVRFELRENPMGEAVSAMLSGAILNLSVILGVFALMLFPGLVFLIVRPLRAISAHIDRLKDSPGGLMLDSLGGVLPIAEMEKIRESLNVYQSQLTDVHTSLEE
jgi:hypothetical protein